MLVGLCQIFLKGEPNQGHTRGPIDWNEVTTDMQGLSHQVHFVWDLAEAGNGC